MKKAILTGITGQDGSYLAEFGFNATTTLREGLGRTVDWYVDSGGTGCK